MLEKIMKSVVSVLGIIAGITIVVVGVGVLYGKQTAPAVSAMSHSVDNECSNDSQSYTFGADFYTEMYGITYDANKNIVKAGDTIASAANQISDNQAELAGVITTSQNNMVRLSGIGMIMVGAIATIAFLYLFVCALSIQVPAKKKVEVPELTQDEPASESASI